MKQVFFLLRTVLANCFLVSAFLCAFFLQSYVGSSEALSKKPLARVARSKVPYASIVMEASTGRVLHEANADTPVFPASLTKMMTLYLAFQALRERRISLEQKVPVSAKAQSQQPCKLGLRKGETLTVRQAILGLVTKSANDAAVAFAEFIDGSEERFAQRMTRQARQLGMHRTHFFNASGLPHKAQKTTARDMATLCKSLWRDFHEESKTYFKTASFQFRGVVHKNHNALLGKVDGIDGMKTGYIAASGFNLAASAKRAGKRMIVVVMGGKNRFWRDAHTTELMDTAFAAPERLASLTALPQGASPIKLASFSSRKKTEGLGGIPSLISRAEAAPPPETPKASVANAKSRGTHFSIAQLLERDTASSHRLAKQPLKRRIKLASRSKIRTAKHRPS